ncbi:MAG TPA: hypothetical protein VFX79_00385 [Candidatus Saccharimonadales bacterium]|nr:hypothetical protein [Candidatus Saccharimonadales bacterium]
MKNLIELIYSLFLAGIVAMFVGFTVWAAYPEPSYPNPTYNYDVEWDETEQQDIDRQYQEYDKKYAEHQGTSAKIILGASVGIFLLGLIAIKSRRFNSIFSDGLLFAGLITALYAGSKSIVFLFSLEQPSRIITFGAALAALIMVLVITQLKFGVLVAKPKKSKRKK